METFDAVSKQRLPVYTDIKQPPLLCEKWAPHTHKNWANFETNFVCIANENKLNALNTQNSMLKRKDTHTHTSQNEFGDDSAAVPAGLSDNDDDGFEDQFQDIDINPTQTTANEDDDATILPIGDSQQIEDALLSAQESYAAIFNQHIVSLNIEAEMDVQTEANYFQIHKRVSEWRTKVDSWMKVVNKQKAFDMKEYKKKSYFGDKKTYDV